MEQFYLVTKVYSNDEDGTGSTPRLFTSIEDASEEFQVYVHEAIDDFISNGYCVEADRDSILKWFLSNKNSKDEEVTSGTLRFSFIDNCYDFWNSTGFDFGYSVEMYEMNLD